MIKVGAALAAAHGKRGQGVLEDLLKTEELDHAQGNLVVETEAALIRTDCRIELDAVAAVDLDLALIVHPGHPENDSALGLHNATDDVLLFQPGIGFHHGHQSLQHLVDGLQILVLLGIACGEILINSVKVCVVDGHR